MFFSNIFDHFCAKKEIWWWESSNVLSFWSSTAYIFQKIWPKLFNFAHFKKHCFYSSLDTATETQNDVFEISKIKLFLQYFLKNNAVENQISSVLMKFSLFPQIMLIIFVNKWILVVRIIKGIIILIIYSIHFQKIWPKRFNFVHFKKHGFCSIFWCVDTTPKYNTKTIFFEMSKIK